MTAPPRGSEAETAMRAVLTQLLQDVMRAENRLDHAQAARLVEANEQLMVSALGALTDAQTAHDALDEATRVAVLDPLTGLPNRTRLLDRLENAIANAKRRGHRAALLFLDLNGFKQINDRRGHAIGDRALRVVADCLRSLVRETDTVSRHGGDEFLILLANIAQAGDAALVAEKVNAALAACGPIDGAVVRLSVSIGISVYPEDGDTAKTLIERADAAMYRAKEQGGASFAFHAAPPDERAAPLALPSAEPGDRLQLLMEANERLVLGLLDAQARLAALEHAQPVDAGPTA